MTHHVKSMLKTYPKDVPGVDLEEQAECIGACFGCAQTCAASADACVEDMAAELTKRTNLDCADICLHRARQMMNTRNIQGRGPGRGAAGGVPGQVAVALSDEGPRRLQRLEQELAASDLPLTKNCNPGHCGDWPRTPPTEP